MQIYVFYLDFFALAIVFSLHKKKADCLPVRLDIVFKCC